ncbi:2Fe-2S iron-sulfur cluster binding domain-containing protein [Sphingomonas sp. AP4-R1]|nr:2Fe-2S iron-sulfur cluster binding domain-containing protein [Sphingomonas sp. AP4-R1]
METIRGAGIDEILAICGGCCSCATCHVYVDASNDIATQASEDEEELLNASSSRRPNSRLSCQIMVTNELDGARFTIAPEG